MKQVLAICHVTSHLETAETPFFLVYGRGPNLPLHILLEPMQQFLGDPESGDLDLRSHCLALAIAKKTLDNNRFKHANKTTNCTPSNFKMMTEYTSKRRNLEEMGSKMESQLQDCLYRVQWHYLHIEDQATGKTRSCNVKDIAHDLPVELLNVDTKFCRAGKLYKSSSKSPHYTPKHILR